MNSDTTTAAAAAAHPPSKSSLSAVPHCPVIHGPNYFRHRLEHRNILFVGYNLARSMYCDLAKMIGNGKMLSVREISTHHSNHANYEPWECQIKLAGKVGRGDRIDTRRFTHQESRMSLYYIHLGTILDRGRNEITAEWLREMTEGKDIHMIIVSCAFPDLCDRHLSKMRIPFEQQFPRVMAALKMVVKTLRETFQPLMIWIPPHASIELSAEKKENFIKILDTCNTIIAEQQTTILDLKMSWYDFLIKNYAVGKFCLQPEAIRELNIKIYRLAQTQWCGATSSNVPSRQAKRASAATDSANKRLKK